jgi:hypothetical protein
MSVAPPDFASWTQTERDAWFAAEARTLREKKTAEATARPSLRVVEPVEPPGVYDPPGEPIGSHVDPPQKLAGLATLAEHPRPLRRQSPPGEQFPVEALGDVLGDAAKAIVDKVQCADALACSSILAAASLSAQSHADVVIPATGSPHPLSLFIFTVAATGDRKSAADRLAINPILQREKRLREQYDADVIDYRRSKRAYDAALGKAEKTGGDRYEIEAALKAVGDEPAAPLLPILTTDEPTVEGLAKLFEKGQPSLGLFSDEGGAFLGGHALANENRLRTMAALSSMWDGSPIRRIRAGDGASILPGRRLALHLMVQPAASAALLADPMAADQGLLSRVLVCAPASTAGTRFQRPLAASTEPALRRYGACLLDLLEKPAPLIPGARNALEPRALPFDAAASAAWGRLADEIERKIGGGGAYEPIRGFANKLAEHVARISGVLTIIGDADAATIGVDALGRAAAIADFYAGEALRLFEAGHVAPELREAEKLLNWLRTWPEPNIGLVAIYQKGPNSIRDAAAAKRAVAVLEGHNWLTRLEGTGHRVAGKPVKEVWRIVRGA